MSQPPHLASSNCKCFNCQVASGNDSFDPNDDLPGWSKYHEQPNPPAPPAAEEGDEEEHEEDETNEDDFEENDDNSNENEDDSADETNEADEADDQDQPSQAATAPPPNVIGTTTDDSGRSRRYARAGYVYQCFQAGCSYVNRDAHEFSGRHLRAWHTRGTETAEQIQGRLILVTEARGRELQSEWVRWRNQQQGRGRRR